MLTPGASKSGLFIPVMSGPIEVKLAKLSDLLTAPTKIASSPAEIIFIEPMPGPPFPAATTTRIPLFVAFLIAS